MSEFDMTGIDFISDTIPLPAASPAQTLIEMDAVTVGAKKKGASVLPLLLGLTASALLLIYLYEKYNEKPNAKNGYQLEGNA